eukprot:Anaeramoba_ignava/a5088_85.p2 GENE.a5088_85~~a5088_85.p2  ORF type:complete len:187 (+),score=28.79 a5088_85:1006-1566(+)
MNFEELLNKRRATRSLAKVKISDDDVRKLANAASLAPSCFNKQPWRFVFVRDDEQLQKIFEILPRGNKWAHEASMIVGVFSKKEDDCILEDREYYLFDTGFATNNIMLKATEMDLISHPIAGFKNDEAKAILNIPDDYTLITLLIMGKKAAYFNESLNEKQVDSETNRPPRKEFEEFAFFDSFKEN